MALLNKLFINRKNKPQTKTEDLFDSPRWEAPAFSKDAIRVLVFRECEWRGRKLLFDWKSIKKTEPEVQVAVPSCRLMLRKGNKHSLSHEKIEGYTEVSHNGITYQYLRPRSDVKMLGEMIFGSVAMSYKGGAIKIHNIRSPPQLMFSKVFPAPVPSSADSDRESEGLNSLQSSMSDCMPLRTSPNKTSSSVAHSVPVDVPAPISSLQTEDDLELIAPSSLRSNSSFSSVRSFQRSPEGSNNSLNSLTRSGSFNSLHRRWMRTVTTSMEFGLTRMPEENVIKDEHVPNNRRTKLAISVVISLGDNEEREKDFQSFFFSHITLIEGHINKLSLAVEKAYIHRRQFVHLVMEGVDSLQQALFDLYTAPRFPEPVWLSMMNPRLQQHVLCLRFITEFMNLLEQCDSKATNFFISTLLTAVLTHHLAWVPTVTPSGILPSQSFHEKHKAKWLDILAKLHPYNPLWIQLGDIYGALGNPSKMARTVIVGRDSDLVKRIMYCLTYFIRCSEVYENLESRVISVSRQQVLSASSTSSGSTMAGDSLHSMQLQDHTPSPQTPEIPREANGEERCSEKPHPSKNLYFPRRLSSVCNLASAANGGGVERQEGEGDEDDDEVFCERAQLRTVRPTSANDKSNRNGIIFNAQDRTNFEKMDLKTKGATEPCLVRDSGVGSYVEAEEGARVGIFLNTDHGKDNSAGKSRRKLTNGKVLFTIGNIPLKDICAPKSGGEREQSPINDILVCTCGKHVPNGTAPQSDSKVSAKAFDDHKPPTLSMSSINAKLIGWEPNSQGESNCNGSTSMSKNDSLTCDSGIHSYEGSRVDLMGTKTPSQTNAVEVLKMALPPVRLEHVRNVGKSGLCADKLTDFIGIRENGTTGDKGGRETSVVDNWKRTNFDYGRTNSMFDEYFDENVELKMLDEQTFQERIKQKRTGDQARLNGEQSSTTGEKHRECLCASNGGKCISRDSLLDGQNDVQTSCTCDTLSMSSSASLWEKPNYSNTRIVMWNSVTSMGSEDSLEFFDRISELPMPKSEVKQCSLSGTNETGRGFGWSLMSNYADHYMSDFALQGTSDNAFGGKLLSDLKMTVQNPILDEEVSEAVCIVANTDNWTVEVVSSRNGAVSAQGAPQGVRVTTSQLVAGMTDSLNFFWKLKLSPEFCLLHLEDRLQEFYFKSRLLAEYFLDSQPSDVQKVASDLGVDTSDLPFLLAISSIHSPEVTCSYGISYR